MPGDFGLTDADRFGLVDGDRFGVDLSCAPVCCEGQPPPDCCPSPCGRRFMLCVSRVRFVEEVRGVWYWPEDGRVAWQYRIKRSFELIGGPVAIPEEPSLGTTPTCRVRGLVPLERIDEREVLSTQPCSPTEPETRSVATICAPVSLGCPPAGAGTDPAAALVTGVEFITAGGFFQPLLAFPAGGCQVTPAGSPGVGDRAWGDRQYTLQCAVQTPGGSLVATQTVEISEHGTYQRGVGTNRFASSGTMTRRGSIVLSCPVTGGGVQAFVLNGQEQTTYDFEVEYELKVIEDCAGAVFSACNGQESPLCRTDRAYIRGVPCNGDQGAPERWWRAANVTACGVVPIGGVCYEVKPSGPRVIQDQDPPNTSDLVIDSSWPIKTCCQCRSGCPKTDLAGSIAGDACIVNVSRDPVSGEWRESPAPFVGVCCCDPDDEFEVVEAKAIVELDDGVGSVQVIEWVGASRFRRSGTELALDYRARVTTTPAPFNCQSFGCIVQPSPQGGGVMQCVCEQLRNFPLEPRPIACGWRWDIGTGGVGRGGLQLTRPWRSAEFAFDGVNNPDLPCPGDTPGGITAPNGWRIENMQWAGICQAFTCFGHWRNMNVVPGSPSGQYKRVTLSLKIRMRSGLGLNDVCGDGCPETQGIFPPSDPNNPAIPTLPFGAGLGGMLPIFVQAGCSQCNEEGLL